jgi:hypothetical protein
MEKLKFNLEKVQRHYRLNRRKLIQFKIKAIIGGLIGLACGFNYSDNKLAKYDLESWEILIANIILVFIVMLPIVFIPIYKFLTDRVAFRISNEIKSSILIDVLDRCPADYKILTRKTLPSSDLKLLKLENGITKFAYGDDLIFGNLNSVPFRLAEVHSVNFFGRSFKGLIGLLEAVDRSESELKCIVNRNNYNIKIQFRNGYLFFIRQAESTLFEYSFRKGMLNKSDLENEYRLFSEFLLEMTNVSLQLSAIPSNEVG